MLISFLNVLRDTIIFSFIIFIIVIGILTIVSGFDKETIITDTKRKCFYANIENGAILKTSTKIEYKFINCEKAEKEVYQDE